MHSKNTFYGLVLTVASLCTLSSFSQNPFEKKYDTPHDRAFRDVLRTSDGGYILCGWSNVANQTENDMMVARTDRDGNMLEGWPKLFGTNGDAKVDFAYSMVENQDGNFMIVGYSSSYGAGDRDIVLFILSPSGSLVGTPKHFGGNSNDEAREIIKTYDNNYVIVGTHAMSSTCANDIPERQACLIKVDKNGNALWSPAIKLFGDPGCIQEFGNTVQEAPDHGLILGGESTKNDPLGDSYFVKTDENGNKLWETYFTGTKGDEATGIVVNSDGSFVACIRDSIGITNGHEDIDVLVKKFNGSTGAQIGWGTTKRLGGDAKDTPKCITMAKDGNYYVGSISRSFNWWGTNPALDYPDMWLMKIDAALGDTMWTRHFGADDHDHLERVKTFPEEINSILLCGHSVSQPYVKKSYFLKISEQGKLEPLAISENEQHDVLSFYPNPSSGKISVTPSNAVVNAEIVITNCLGQQVYKVSDLSISSGNSHTCDLSDEKAGVYVITVKTKTGVSSKKIILN